MLTKSRGRPPLTERFLSKFARKYDLKGSTVDREASEKERSKRNPTWKDNDFVKDNIKLYIKQEDKQRIMEMLESDCAFLSKENLMDYSLCLGKRLSLRAFPNDL